jgi:quercetin dioxygenase-like cupin family protein
MSAGVARTLLSVDFDLASVTPPLLIAIKLFHRAGFVCKRPADKSVRPARASVLKSSPMRIRLMFPALLLAAFTLAAQNPSAVELTAEPAHHLLFENQYTRVFSAMVPPHQATLLHRHGHDYVFVSIGPSDVSNEVEGKAPVELKMQDGETRFASGGFVHIARNLAETPFRVVAIEFLQDEAAHKTPPPKWDEERGLHILQGGTQDIVFVQDGVRVSGIDLQPGGVIPKHHHATPHLVVAVTDLNLRADNADGSPPAAIKLNAGDAHWVPPGATHIVTNIGKQEAKFVTLEFQ